jgi:single-stranded-DNA-specific exonuclease
MISVSGRNWESKKTSKNEVEKIKQDYNFSDIVSKLISSRKFDENELSSIDNNLHLNNVFLKNKDYQKSITIVIDAINNNENICILGDYDVDGSAATSLFIRFFESINQPFFYYIPDRENDGYGASTKLFKKLILKKPKLIIMVDCGSTSNEAIDYLNNKEIKSLIIDHHEINKPFPKANCIINPKKNNGYIKYDYLCATTLVYFFLDLLSKKIKSKMIISDFLIYVLLATICDVMPLRKLNRLIAIVALKNFKINKNLAFKELFDLLNKKSKLTIEDLGYIIGPILNAGGRLGKSAFASELLSSNNQNIVNLKSQELIKLNNKRKKIEKLTLDEINFEKIDKENEDIIVYYNPSINEGLIGIIAARLKDYFYKPAVVITSSAKTLKGSARSVHNYNVGRAIKNLSDKEIISSGGGHNMAAGFTLEKNKLSKFKDTILKDFSNSMTIKNDVFLYDAEISTQAFNSDFYNDIKKLEPFGTSNPNPIFLFKDLKVIKINILNNKHLSVILKSKIGFSIKSISFNSINNKVGEHLLNYKKNLNVLAQINENIWNNKKVLQLTILDLII